MPQESMSKGKSIIAVTRRGARLGEQIRSFLPDSELHVPQRFASESGGLGFQESVGEVIRREFGRSRDLVLIMAMGIAVRSMVSEMKGKYKDPAVVVVDEFGRFAVSLLSGHLGGANALAETVASCIGAQPVITTSSDVSGNIALDLLGHDFGWQIEKSSNLTRASAALANGDEIGLYQDAGETDWKDGLPENIHTFPSLDAMMNSSCQAAIIITDRTLSHKHRALLDRAVVYRPRSLIVGIGCNRGTSAWQIKEAVTRTFKENSLSLKSIRKIATVDLKRDEEGLIEFAQNHGVEIDFWSKEALEQGACPSGPSEAVLENMGIPGVCEPAALLSSGNTELLVPKTKLGDVTIAIARVPFEKRRKKGKLFLVGIGPGDSRHMTPRAREALVESSAVVGYRTYVKMVEPFLPGKEVVAKGMGKEVERVKEALRLAESGKTVSIVCSGDSGIYGMAGLAGELARERGEQGLEMEVVPGVPALVSCAALLGAPLIGDFASVSLSDYLVRWEDIVKRLELAAQGDFVIVIYNPTSKHRKHQLVEARDILVRHRGVSIPVGIVSNAYRPGQEVILTDLGHMLDFEIGMTSTIVVGNSGTFISGDWMVTPRGYGKKCDSLAT